MKVVFCRLARRDLVRIRKMSVMKMKESPEYLSVLLQVFTYQTLPPGGSLLR